MFFTNRLQSAAVILHQKPCGALTPGPFAHNGTGFERNYLYLVLFPTFHRVWRVPSFGPRRIAFQMRLILVSRGLRGSSVLTKGTHTSSSQRRIITAFIVPTTAGFYGMK